MPMPRPAVALAAILLAVGCSSPSTLRRVPVQQFFLDIDHRRAYAISNPELMAMRFYVSANVLLRGPKDDPRIEGGSDGTLLIRRVDPGTVREIGPNWLRISFAGGSGVLFMSPGTPEDQHYYLATELPGREGMFRPSELPEKAVLYEGAMYPIVYGAETELLVDVEDLRVVVAKREVKKS